MGMTGFRLYGGSLFGRKEQTDMIIGIVGLGLIGGSLARTIRLHTDHTVLGLDTNPVTMRQAFLMEAIHGELDSGNLSSCDLLLVALYPSAIVQWVEEHAKLISRDTVVIDCGGVKQAIVSRLQDVAAENGFTYIGGHPMAGREVSGFRHARDDLFDNASMILTPRPGEDLHILQRMRDFFMDLGFRRVCFSTPQEHDEMIAFTSQLAHVVSSAYVKCPLAGRHRGFSAGSFADMTRVAKLSEDMWTELFFDNRDALLAEVSGMVDRLSEYRDALRDNDREKMHRLLKEGREIKEALEEN